jgi:hypothetical protein
MPNGRCVTHPVCRCGRPWAGRVEAGPGTLAALGERLGIQHPAVDTKTTCVDGKRQWRHASNIWHNSMIRSVLQTMAAPVIGLAHLVRRDKSTAQT